MLGYSRHVGGATPWLNSWIPIFFPVNFYKFIISRFLTKLARFGIGLRDVPDLWEQKVIFLDIFIVERQQRIALL